MMLPGPLKVTIILGMRFVPLDNAERLECVTAKRLRTLLWTGKAAGLGSSLPSPSGQQPWGEGGTSRTAGTESMGSVRSLSELCATTAWAGTPLQGSHILPLCPSSPSQAGGRGDQSISSPHGPQPRQRWKAAVPAGNSEYPGHLFIPALQDLFLPL